eukprot:SAG11_NODE_37934_length_254_cov_1.329032_2_plen_45_part_01
MVLNIGISHVAAVASVAAVLVGVVDRFSVASFNWPAGERPGLAAV